MRPHRLVLVTFASLVAACSADPGVARTPKLAVDANVAGDADVPTDANVATDARTSSDAQISRDANAATDAQSSTDAESASDARIVDAGADSGVVRDVFPGEPIVAPDGQWVRVEVPGTTCRNGNQGYMMVHLNSASSKVAIYEESGGACFSDASCTLLNLNPPSYVLGGGIFNFARADNPIRDWNVFYIPYCTGDVHAGDNTYDVGGLTGTTSFHGYSNLKAYLSRILATAPEATDMLLVGSSAGGFGSGLTADLVARNAPSSVERFTLLDDSGPPLSSTYIPPCLQERWRTVWGLDGTVLRDCGSSCPDPNDYISDLVQFLLAKYTRDADPNRFVGGLVSSTKDLVIREFFGFGANDCVNFFGPSPLPAAAYTSGLLELRATVAPLTDRFGTFYYDSTQHTTLVLDSGNGVLGGLYDTQAGGVKLVDWMRDLIERRQTSHVGP